MNRILLVDDHEIMRSGLKFFLNNIVAHYVIDEAWDGDSAFEKIKENEYQLIILDINMPGTDSFGLVSNITTIKPGAKILIFSMNSEEVYAKRYLQLGAKGYINKTAPSIELEKAVKAVLKNERYISPALNIVFNEEALGNNTNNPFENLSSREFEILQHLITGESIGEISNTFNLQSSTVGTYKARIFEKLQCKNLVEAIEMARVYYVSPKP